MNVELQNVRAADGSRLFAEVRDTIGAEALVARIQAAPEADSVCLLTDGIVESWIDFRYRDRQFTVNTQFGDFWFFVNDASCPDEILKELLSTLFATQAV